MFTLEAQIRALQEETKELRARNLELARRVTEMNIARVKAKHKTVARRVTKTKKRFVASKTASKFHTKDCAFASNIKPKNRLTFASKNTALNNGFKRCACVA